MELGISSASLSAASGPVDLAERESSFMALTAELFSQRTLIFSRNALETGLQAGLRSLGAYPTLLALG